VDSKTPVVRARLAPFGEGLQVMIYTPDREALFARICGYFERAASISSRPRSTPRATATRWTPSW
jgi:UTP:GlnB (protein PII) uridylyltransferase